MQPITGAGAGSGLRRSLTLRHLILYGIIVIQPTAPMPVFGLVAQEARGHVVSAVLVAMVAMLLTALSYGRMARVHPSAGSAYVYVARELHPGLGYLAGWSMVMDYMLNPLVSTIFCSKIAGNLWPQVPFPIWAVIFASTFTLLNLLQIRTNARINTALAAGMGVVIAVMLSAAARFVWQLPEWPPGLFTRPFYDPATFSAQALFTGTSIAALTYIGFDGISTLSEEVENPRRNVMLATVLTCLITGVVASLEVYAAQLVWPETTFPDADTAYAHVAGRAGGPVLFQVVNATLLVATLGSGMGSMLGAARLLYGMGTESALPRSFFGFVDARGVPRNNVLLVGAVALVGAFTLSFQLGVELLNFGAFIAFMGVNAAAFARYVVRDRQRTFSTIVPPILGFAACLFIWLNLRWQAKVVGAIWLAIGLLYGLYVRSSRVK